MSHRATATFLSPYGWTGDVLVVLYVFVIAWMGFQMSNTGIISEPSTAERLWAAAAFVWPVSCILALLGIGGDWTRLPARGLSLLNTLFFASFAATGFPRIYTADLSPDQYLNWIFGWLPFIALTVLTALRLSKLEPENERAVIAI